MNTLVGAKKRLRLLKLENSEKNKKSKYDPNIVGLEQSSGDSSSESEEDLNRIDIEQDKEIEINENVNLNNSEKVQNNLIVTTKLVEEHIEPLKDKESNNNIYAIKSNIKEEVKKPVLEHSTIHVEVKRDPKIQVARLKLPILGEEQRIMELINENEFVIVAGETGKIAINVNKKCIP